MVNRILMELYDDYEKGNRENLIDFTNKTFSKDGTDKLFIVCVLISFSKVSSFKPRYDVSRENLLSIVLTAKEKNSINLLAFYLEKMNNKKGINKYLKGVVNSENVDKYADLIIEYLNQFKPKFLEEVNYFYLKKDNNMTKI